MIEFEQQKPKRKKWKISLVILGIIIISLFGVTATLYVRGGGPTVANVVNDALSSNTHRHSVTNASDSEVYYYDNEGNIQGRGNSTFIGGYFTYLGSLPSRITKGWFTDIDVSGTVNSTSVNTTNINVINTPSAWTTTQNTTYDTWLPNYTTYNKFWYNMTCPTCGQTYNWSYNNLLGQMCPVGQVVNGTQINGTLICTTVSVTGGGNMSFNQTLTDSIYVPYIGAIKNVDLGVYNITATKYMFSQNTTLGLYVDASDKNIIIIGDLTGL